MQQLTDTTTAKLEHEHNRLNSAKYRYSLAYHELASQFGQLRPSEEQALLEKLEKYRKLAIESTLSALYLEAELYHARNAD